MENKSPVKIKILYFILYLLMDIESLCWDFTEIIVKPIMLLRNKVIKKLSVLNNQK